MTNHGFELHDPPLVCIVDCPSTAFSQFQSLSPQKHPSYIAHRNFIPKVLLNLLLGHPIHLSSRLQNQQLQHLSLSLKFHNRKLNALIRR